MLEFAEFSKGKRLKTGSKPNEYKPTGKDMEHYSPFERVAA
eukprot:CAMPEP_0176363610 /NCGR_PEP_ID=MMETSP0126-20121128/19228_1 /TAXON_ID=141414 ORGANISM="Strombidinopsis acuminatum, Strain SPMC142" /NCGR_SAMPLE_ID=MMETSP0126 /ASSEMBLY_ACC=CAM_ASM_000229 /LENGTH=40 /DNA_ID= /DNA_START= /DNA_END= /DNA_ORIENTATION=